MSFLARYSFVVNETYSRERQSSDQPSLWKWIIHWSTIESSGFDLLLFIMFCVNDLDEGTVSKNSKSTGGTKIGSTK